MLRHASRFVLVWISVIWLLSATARGDVPPPPPPPGKSDVSVTVGSKPFTENIILGEMLRHLALSTGADADHLASLGGTQILWEALKSGKLDAYPEYTGTLLQEIFAGKTIRSGAELVALLEREGIRMSGK